MVAWIVVILAFFILAIQLFITILEFQADDPRGFVLVPFALWGKTAFLLAERGSWQRRCCRNQAHGPRRHRRHRLDVVLAALPQVFSSGDITIEQALSTVLGALAIFMLGIFGPGIAAGLISGAPQLGAGAAVGSAAGLVLGGAAAGGAALGGARAAAGAAGGATRAASSMAGGASSA
ncbi:MAG: hypothetical protein AcusKO_42370 [Acuticoccus sp.]